MSANWGSILFLINLSLNNNFLYSSSETNLLVSKTPYGTVKGLIKSAKLPEFFSIWLSTSIFLFNLWRVTNLEDGLVSVLLDNFNLVDCHIIQEGRYDFPWHRDAWWSINNPQFEQSSTVVKGYFFEYIFKQCGWDLAQPHPSEVINEIPAFNLSGDEYNLLHFLKNKASGLETIVKIFKVDLGGVIYEDGSEMEISSRRVEITFFLCCLKRVTMRF